MNVQTLPRTVIRAYLSAARLPLKAAARASHQQDNEQWPPALAFEGFEASVESLLGSLLRDDRLMETGRLRQAKVAQWRKAAQLEAAAESTRTVAQEEFDERQQAAASKRADAAQRAEQREQQIEAEARQRKTQAQVKAAKQAAGARRTKAAVDAVIDREERTATREALATETAALRKQQEALESAETVDVIEQSIEGTKQARSS
jgi:hypothetical protein